MAVGRSNHDILTDFELFMDDNQENLSPTMYEELVKIFTDLNNIILEAIEEAVEEKTSSLESEISDLQGEIHNLSEEVEDLRNE